MAAAQSITDEELRKIRAETHLTFGKEYLRAGRYEEALAAFEEAGKIDPKETRALMGRSLALTRLGRYDEALGAANDIFRLAPNNPHGYNAQAVVYQATGRMVEAQAAFEKSIAFGPNLAGNHYNFACFWAARAEAERCREHLTKALELEPRLNVIAATDVDFEQYRGQDWFLELVAFK